MRRLRKFENPRGFENPNSNQNGAEDREQRADEILRFLDTAENEFLHSQKFEEIFSNEENKRKFIENLSDEEFSELLNSINGILRGKEKEDWKMDGETVALIGAVEDHVPPRQKDKPELLTKVLSAAKEMNQNKRDLKDIALLFSSSINAIHPYLDGNGRTSRLIYLLLTKDFKKDETKMELKEVLSKYGSDKININPGFIGCEIDSLIENEIGIKDLEINKDNIRRFSRKGLVGDRQDIESNQEISETDKKLFFDFLNKDYEYFFWSVFEYLQDNPDVNKEKYLKKIPNDTNHTVAISISILSKDLDNKIWNKIFQNYKNLKKRYVEKLIDCIANPNKEEYQIKIKGQKTSLKDCFENKIKEEQEEARI